MNDPMYKFFKFQFLLKLGKIKFLIKIGIINKK